MAALGSKRKRFLGVGDDRMEVTSLIRSLVGPGGQRSKTEKRSKTVTSRLMNDSSNAALVEPPLLSPRFPLLPPYSLSPVSSTT